jgi:hypothetical protein
MNEFSKFARDLSLAAAGIEDLAEAAVMRSLVVAHSSARKTSRAGR